MRLAKKIMKTSHYLARAYDSFMQGAFFTGADYYVAPPRGDATAALASVQQARRQRKSSNRKNKLFLGVMRKCLLKDKTVYRSSLFCNRGQANLEKKATNFSHHPLRAALLE